ncbi:MAG: phosphoribosylglycinamide formyltransferase, partial [Pseudomonadota bacterium]
AKLVLSNRPEAAGLKTARRAGLATLAVDHKDYGSDREMFERHLDTALRDEAIEVIALAGFMRVLTPWFVNRWAGRLINIHPSLLPRYPGLNTHARALDAGDKYGGCTVHWVAEGVDTGDVIDQARVEIKADDSPTSLAERVLIEEHKLYPAALKQACEQIRLRSAS